MLTLVIQAGGESRRMGQDKALLSFQGKALIQHVLDRVRPIADETLVTTNRPQAYSFLDVPLITDVVPGRGALGGLYTALFAASESLVAVIACDMPFVNPNLLAAERDLLIATQSDLVIPHLPDGLEPFHAVYRRETCLPPLKAALDADKWRVDAWFSQVKLQRILPEQIQPYDPDMLSFWNVNTPEELERAQEFARRITP
jgi:molybdopterin-guanine dinucleotide biosynthesis protein A